MTSLWAAAIVVAGIAAFDALLAPVVGAPAGAEIARRPAWAGHGELAFVSSGRLRILNDRGVISTVSGPRGGWDGTPEWSSNGRWLAFLHTTELGPYTTTNPTLWVLRRGSTVATEVTSNTVGAFAWSPSAPVLAFSSSPPTSPSAAPEQIWFDRLGVSETVETVGSGLGVEDLAWSPNGGELAFDDIASTGPDIATSRVARVGVLSSTSGASILDESTTNGLELAGWWPDGQGLLFWVDTRFSASLQAGGLPLDTMALDGSQAESLLSSLVGPEWLAPDPNGNEVAVDAGVGREIWFSGRRVDLCDPASASCSSIATSSPAVGLAPTWTSTGSVLFAEGQARRPHEEDFDEFGPRQMAAWDAGNRLWTSRDGVAPTRVRSAPAGSVAAESAASGGWVVSVAHNALWVFDASLGGRATRVAGPLFSSGAPPGYYGEVDWAATFAWSEASGPRGASDHEFLQLRPGVEWPMP